MVPFVGSSLIPAKRLFPICRDSQTVLIKNSELVLRIGVPILSICCLKIQFCGFFVTLFHTVSIFVQRAQIKCADLTAAFDPLYPEVFEKRNASRINYGMGICKFTGARGKSGTSDASAELVAYLRRLYEKKGVIWQLCELGKVDQGGGGTIAKFMANRNIDTIDAGVPVLSMHAPFEVVAKLDCYMTYKGVLAAYEDK